MKPYKGSDDAIARVRTHYENLFSEFGPTPNGVGWGQKDRQRLRYLACLEGMPLENASVVEVGSGYGPIAPLLVDRKVARYVGIDLVDASVQHAIDTTRAYPWMSFVSGDFRDIQLQSPCDFGVASGVLNTSEADTDHMDMLEQFLEWMETNTRLGCSFNVLRAPESKTAETLNYYVAGDVISSVSRRSRKFWLDAKSLPFEYTVHVSWLDDVDRETSTFAISGNEQTVGHPFV